MEVFDLLVDVFELGVAIRMRRPLKGFLVGLKAEPQVPEQAADQFLTGRIAAISQRPDEVALTLAHPEQRRFGIATDRRLHKVTKRLHEARLCLGLWLATAAGTTDAADQRAMCVPQIREAAPDRATRNAGGLVDSSQAATPCGLSLVRREQATGTFV